MCAEFEDKDKNIEKDKKLYLTDWLTNMGKWSSILFEQNPQLQKRQEIIFDHAGDSGVQSLKTKTKI